jgi:hypothetical protein
LSDLVRVNMELLRQFGQRLIAVDRGQGYFRFEGRRVIPAGQFAQRPSLFCSHFGPSQAETPHIPLAKFVWLALITI